MGIFILKMRVSAVIIARKKPANKALVLATSSRKVYSIHRITQ